MDKSDLQHVEPRVLDLLRTNQKGLGTGALLTAIDEIETAKDLVALLGDMKGRGLISKNPATELWVIAPGAASDEQRPDNQAVAPLHPCAEAILRVLADAAPNRVRRKDLNAKLGQDYNEAVIGWHVKQLITKRLMTAGPKNSDGYGLPGAAAPGRSAPKAAKRQPNTALISKAAAAKTPPPPPAAAQEPPPAAESKPAVDHDITIGLTCPAGHIKVEGTPKLVFGFLEQLKELAA